MGRGRKRSSGKGGEEKWGGRGLEVTIFCKKKKEVLDNVLRKREHG